ncbi:Clathrin interactor 1 [Nymphaea thermarum]|nr:Clathrin interactor 1 [Nymphaea thermarum]
MPVVSNSNMGTPFFSEMKKQASFFLRDKLRSARLALTDVTPAQLMTEEATNGNPWVPDARTMSMISKAAFEIGDYWRIVEVLHKRLEKFDRKNWRRSYQALVLLEHLLTHGPESVCREFEGDKQVIKECGNFQYIDEKGFNWGLAVRKKSEMIQKFLDQGDLLKEERQRARKLTREIQGFGSFSLRSSNSPAQTLGKYNKSIARCNSQCNDYPEQEDLAYSTDTSSTEISKCRSSSDFSADSESPVSSINSHEVNSRFLKERTDESNSMKNNEENDTLMIIKKNGIVSSKSFNPEDHDDDWDPRKESRPLLAVKEEGLMHSDSPSPVGSIHPFSQLEVQSRVSLLSSRTQ